jgi:Mrp family chromosome partitioning ATPase
MSIWEEVYSKHKGGERSPGDLQADQNPQPKPPDDTIEQQTRLVETCSLEETYYQNSRPKPSKQTIQEPESEPLESPKTAKARFVPRILGKLTTPYPALLSKMRRSLSDAWANIMLETKQEVRTLLICGSAGKEGATLISFHLAMFLSKEYSMKVLYVDTNLNHTAIPKIRNLPGVYSFISEKKDLAPLVVQTEYPGLYLLPSGAGTIGKNIGSNMLSREHIENLVQFCRKNFDMTIIDGQPLVSSPVMIEFARAVDMTLLVCRYGFSRYEVSKLAVDKLQKFGITSIGVILNDRQFPVPQKLYKIMG